MKKCVFMLLTILFYINQAGAIPVGFDATDGTWVISATDASGLTWDSSTLNFESQTPDGDNFLLEGYFNWIGSNGSYGRENFTGVLFSDSTLELSGFELVRPYFNIITAKYVAVLEDSGTEIVNGSWGSLGSPVIPSDDWSAVLQTTSVSEPGIKVSEPGFIWLLCIGVIALLWSKRDIKLRAA